MTDEPVKIEQKPIVPAVNPGNQFFQSLAASLSGGDPSALFTAIGATPEQAEQLKASMLKDDMRWAKMGAQFDRMADAMQMLANATDAQTLVFGVFGNRLNAVQREQDLQKRVWSRMSGDFSTLYDEEKARRAERDAAEKAKYEKEHPKVEAMSNVSPKVTTPKADVKVA